jgi:hypothetical protein
MPELWSIMEPSPMAAEKHTVLRDQKNGASRRKKLRMFLIAKEPIEFVRELRRSTGLCLSHLAFLLGRLETF